MALSMSAEFERPAAALGGLSGERRPPGDDVGGEGFEAYRVLCPSAVLSCGIAVCSVVALVDIWQLRVVPILGLIVGTFALVRIARAPDELSGRKLAVLGTAGSAFFLLAGMGLSYWTYATEVPADAVRVSYEDLKPSPAAPHSASQKAAELNGRRVFIKGYMFPTPHDKGVTKFVLCRDNGDCCFGGQPPTSDMILVKMQEPLDTEYTTRLRKVAGTFRVAGGRWTDVNQEVLYQLDADYIK
jgi:hypothetical protein